VDPFTIATWRYEQIAFFFDEALSEDERLSLLAQKTKQSVLWPNGETSPVSRSTLYRWKDRYCNPCEHCSERKACSKEIRCEHRLQALLPKKRKDAGKAHLIKPEWIEKAVQLLVERPKRSLNFLLILLATYFLDLDISRSTLDRRLKAHLLWPYLYRKRKGGRRRCRFEAKKIHDIWHADAKGPFKVKFQSGKEVTYHILTILDGVSRAVLAATLASSENLGAAVRLFRQAIARWGLPYRVYADRHSTYDSKAFREGLAVLGIRRIPIKRKKGKKRGNPQPNGKIEAYHRMLENWFIQELLLQIIADEHHLNELLQAFVGGTYQNHYHRELRMSPAEMLDERRSDRPGKSLDDVDRAFRVRRRRQTHRITGEITLAGGTFTVKAAYVGKKVDIAYDPAAPERAFLVDHKGNEIPLRPIKKQHKPKKSARPAQRGAGTLQRLTDVWRGRRLPISEAGFGFPEVCDAIGARIGRPVPANEKEAIEILNFHRKKGPFATADFTAALDKAIKKIGTRRALKPLLNHLERLTNNEAATNEKEKR